MAARLPHDVSPFLQRFRDLLLGRIHNSPLRFPERVAARTQPQPVLPDGCSSKLADNYYFTRDGRRLIKPAEVLVINQSSGEKLLIASKPAQRSGAVTVTEKKPKTPGPMYLPPLVRSCSVTKE